MSTTKDIIYFLASPEASALIQAHFAAMDAHKSAAFAMRNKLGATAPVFLRDRLVGFQFKDKPLPEGWKAPAKKLGFPPQCGVGPTGWDAEIPPLPSNRKLDLSIGIGDAPPISYFEAGKLYQVLTGYGYETVQGEHVISMQTFDGVPHGNPPAGCQPIKKSEYYALRGE